MRLILKKGLTTCGLNYFCAMDFEIITIGDELLIGQTVDTNSVYLAKQLGPLGLNVSRKTSIRDNKSDIIEALEESLQRVDFVIVTGGLGPTNDDITKNVLHEYFGGGEMRLDAEVLAHLERIFANRGRVLLDINKSQAELPGMCKTLFNEIGTAPGMLFEHNGKWVASMPGVPTEVKSITEKSLMPLLKQRYSLAPALHRTLITTLIPESIIAKKLETYETEIQGCKLAYLPTFNSVRLRLTRIDDSLSVDIFEGYWERLKQTLGSMLFHDSDIPLSEWLVNMLKYKNLTISTAESCTGGYLGNQLVIVPGASSVFKGSIIAYDNQVKNEVLGVSNELIHSHGAVSAEVAEAMVLGASNVLKTDVSIATTGIAGPTGGTPEKPVGTVYISVKFNDQVKVEKHLLRGNRIEFMKRAETVALSMLKDLL